MQKDKQLKPGDVIYEFYSNRLKDKHTIARVTPTQAVVRDGLRFRKNFANPNYLHDIGRSNASSQTFKLESEILKTAYHRLSLKRKAKAALNDLDALDNPQLESILLVINKPAEFYKLVKKADKHDLLESKIAACYPDDDIDEIPDADDGDDLITIGEIAATHFGFL